MKGYLTAHAIAKLCGYEKAERRQYTVKCPVHKDGWPSLRIAKGRKATVLYCNAGCSLDEICKALEIGSEMLYHDYQESGSSGDKAESVLNDMIRRRIAPDRWELEPHESFEDVVYEVMDVSPEVWATVKARWHDELVKPFMDVWNQWYTMEAIVMDLLVEHLDKGWDYNVQRRNDLRWKLFNEWKAHGERT